MKEIKAVFSDGGNILFSDVGVKRGPYEQIKPYIPDLTFEDFRDGFQQYKILAQTSPNYGNRNALQDYLISIGKLDVFDSINQKKKGKKSEGRQLELIDGIYETLNAFHKHNIPFIVLTDATKPGVQLQPFLAKLGIEQFVTGMISSKDVRVRKPDPIFFNKALEQYGLSKDEVIFVAHDDDELIGGHKFGFRVYAFNYESTQDLSWLPNEQKIQNFTELENIVLNSRLSFL